MAGWLGGSALAQVGRLELAGLTAGLRGRLRAWPVTWPSRAPRLAVIGAGRPVSRAWRVLVRGWLGGVELDLDADGVGDAGQVGGVAGDDGGLVADGGGDDDRVGDVGGPGGGAGHARRAAGAGVGGGNVAAPEAAGGLVLGAGAPSP